MWEPNLLALLIVYLAAEILGIYFYLWELDKVVTGYIKKPKGRMDEKIRALRVYTPISYLVKSYHLKHATAAYAKKKR